LDEDAVLCPASSVLAKNRLFLRRDCLAELCNCKMPIKGKTFYVSLSLCVQNNSVCGKGNRHSMLEGMKRRGKMGCFLTAVIGSKIVP